MKLNKMKLSIFLYSALFSLLNINCSNAGTASSSNADEETVKASNTANTSSSSNNTNDTITRTHFGVMVAKTEGKIIPPSQQVKVAQALGVKYIRGRIDIQGWAGSNDSYDTYAAAGLKVILNINYGIPRSATGDHDPIPFPTDMTAYSKALNSILDKYKPEVVVIENEEDNPNYHSGSAEDYINELKTGIEIVHAKGLKVANGGITYREACLIIYDDMVQHGDKQKANEFAQKVFTAALSQRLKNANPQVQRQLEFGRKIIAAYKTLNLDYVNFHWYEPVKARGAMGENTNDTIVDATIFEFAAGYLTKLTGKQTMSNEFGVFNPSVSLIKGLLQAVRDAKLAYAIFYSADGGGGKAVALQNGFGELRQNGNAFKDFVKQQQ